VVELLGRGGLERVDLAPLRVHARQDVLDRAVLAGGVHRLEDQEEGPLVLGVEPVLERGEELDAPVEQLGRVVLLELQAPGVARVVVLQAELLSALDAIRT